MEGSIQKDRCFPSCRQTISNKNTENTIQRISPNSTDLDPHNTKGENFISVNHTIHVLVVKILPQPPRLQIRKCKMKRNVPESLIPWHRAWKKTLMNLRKDTTQKPCTSTARNNADKEKGSDNLTESYGGQKTGRRTNNGKGCLSQWKERQIIEKGVFFLILLFSWVS
ncbi:hypothetical protein V8G54_008656 [Vigna mungo]|uniref:Uncharacterized protein n=1 Tax=Vigna mungo TaxID=3915 RepID=A0AAQ3SA88_VIGMU